MILWFIAFTLAGIAGFAFAEWLAGVIVRWLRGR